MPIKYTGKWAKFKCAMPAEAARLLEAELGRIKRVAGIYHEVSVVEDGLALELMATLSATTPEASLGA